MNKIYAATKKGSCYFFILIAVLCVAAQVLAAQTVDSAATVVCGKSEQATPCILVLDRSVPSYELKIKKGDSTVATFKVDRIKDMWQILGERRKDRVMQVIVDTGDASCVVVNPRLPKLGKDIIPDGCDGLIIKAVEVKA